MNINQDFNYLNENIISKKLCCGCGTCVGVCPTNAIDFRKNRYFPEWIDELKCIACGFCSDVCPGKGLDLDNATKRLKTNSQEHDINIGNYKQFMIGHSEDEYIRVKSSSGGVATSLLTYALDKKIVDKVIVVVNDENEIAKPIAKITSSKEEILLSMQSKYIQVPLNKLLKEILKSNYKYAIIGLPCHIQGLYLAQKKYKRLSERIILKIGLFCGYSYSYECIDTLLKRLKISKNEVEKFLGWREGDSYPGYFSMKLKNGDISSLSFVEEHNIDTAFYSLFRCFLCIDGLCQLADISLGDTPNAPKNNTFIITRTDFGDELLQSAKVEGYVNYNVIDKKIALNEGIIPFMLQEKRFKVLAVIQHLSKRNISVPEWDINTENIKISKIEKINGILRVKLMMFVRTHSINKFLCQHPKLMEKIGGLIYHIDINPKSLIIRSLNAHPKLICFIKHCYYSPYLKGNGSNKDKIMNNSSFLENLKFNRKFNKRIPVGVVGLGGWGSQYIPIIHKSKLFELKVCFDTNKDTLESVSSKIGCYPAKSFDELLTFKDLKAIFILTPNFLHYEQCMKAIKKRKHVFVEKPLANTVEDAEKIYNAAKENNVVVSVGHNVRRRSEFRMVKRIIENNEIGKVIMVEANSSQSISDSRERGWRIDKRTCPAGVLSQLGIHHIDTLRYLFGEIENIKSYTKKESLGSKVPDTVMSIFSFKSGVLGYLGTNYLSEFSFTMKIYGTKGNLIVEDSSLYLQKQGKKKRIKHKLFNTVKLQIEEFGNCIINNTTPEIGIIEATQNISVIEKIMQSSEEMNNIMGR